MEDKTKIIIQAPSTNKTAGKPPPPPPKQPTYRKNETPTNPPKK
jgi:hypothetical protein